MSEILWLIFSILICCSDNIQANVVAKSEPHFIPNIRIFNGDDVTPHSVPYMVAMSNTYMLNNTINFGFCSGTLISQNYVMTVAHCFYNLTKLVVILGAYNWRQREPTQVIFTLNMSAVTIHENYTRNDTHRECDIALIKLPTPVTYNEYIQPSPLPADDSQSYEGRRARLYAWGLTYVPLEPNIRYLPSKLKYADFTVAPSTSCIPMPPEYDGNVCIVAANGKGTCKGDSGGPLVVDGIQIGLSSYGFDICDYQNTSSYFTRVGRFVDWIEKNSDWTADKTSLGVPQETILW